MIPFLWSALAVLNLAAGGLYLLLREDARQINALLDRIEDLKAEIRLLRRGPR